MKEGGGNRSSNSSRSSKSSMDDADDLADLVIGLVWWLMESSLFFKYLFAGGFLYLILWAFLSGITVTWLIPIISFLGKIYLITWLGYSMYCLYLDIVDLYTFTKLRVKGQEPTHLEVSITSLSGIGPKRAKKFNALGIFTLADLARADIEQIRPTGISEKLLVRFIQLAQERTGLLPEETNQNV